MNRNRGNRMRQNINQSKSSLRTIQIISTVFLACISCFLVFAVKNGQKRRKSNSQKLYLSPNEISSSQLLQLDAIIVLGGGAPLSLDEPPIYVQRRCDDAAAVIEMRKMELTKSNIMKKYDHNLPILSLSAGTAHVPQLLSQAGLPIWESTSSAAYLHKKHGIDYSSLFVETTSYDTIGNAYFTRTSHTDINGWRRLLIVTNKVCRPLLL